MPIAKYFKGKGKQVMSSMKDQYGDKTGEQVFHATANKQGMTPNDNDGDEGMMPSSTSRPAEQKMGAAMAKSMPKRKSLGQRLAAAGGMK